MADEKELIKRRGTVKGRLTVYANYLAAINISELDEAAVSELQLRVTKLEDLYNLFDSIQSQLELSGDLETNLRERSDFESLYFRSLSKSQTIINNFEKNLNKLDKDSRASSCSNSVRLPTISLPKFNGSYDSWMEFRDLYISLIHENDDIVEINKFHYLRASLEGAAAVAIKSIEFSKTNYQVAWQCLLDRYDNKRILIFNHVSELFNISAVSKESSQSLKSLIDQVNKNLRILESLGEPVKSWDTLLIYLISIKIDQRSYREWEEVKAGMDKSEFLTFEYFMKFLKTKADLIETLELKRNTVNQLSSNTNKSHININSKQKALVSVQNNSNQNTTTTLHSLNQTKRCPKCSENHTLINCPQFLSLNVNDKLEILPSLKVCYNCFRSGHYANRCKKHGCSVCKRKHNTLIHVAEFKQQLHKANTNQNSQHDRSCVQLNDTIVKSLSANVIPHSHSNNSEILLATALVKIKDFYDNEITARALLDSGSTSCLMTEALCQRLSLPITQVHTSLSGINNVSSHIAEMCKLKIKSHYQDFTREINCFVLQTITDKVPSRLLDISHFKIPSNICLADPDFYKPSGIDLIIGADVFWDLLCARRIKLGHEMPILSESKLGWFISGPTYGGQVSSFSKTIKCNFVSVDSLNNDPVNDDVQNLLSRFWQLEEVCHKSSFSPEEQLCEDHFVQNTTRLPDGRFCVKIPLKQSPELLGNSFKKAKASFLSLERRNSKNPTLDHMYKDFMSEYIALGHMTKVESPFSKDLVDYFIPHHGVIRESSLTTKLRVVFNASSFTSTGTSLNQLQMVGPTVQDDLLSILIRFRQHKFIISADICKFYRQVVVHPQDRHLQKIIWRDNPESSLNIYELGTVTYGTASAPFLATRCLKQVGLECTDERIRELIIHDFYVDDLLSGGDSLEEVIYFKSEVTSTLAAAGMPLRKWKSNESQLMSVSDKAIDLNFSSSESSKVLGLSWSIDFDKLNFPVSTNQFDDTTKRDVLSTIAQIFDPLGLLSPVIIKLKMLLQQLWLHKLSWNDKLPPQVHKDFVDLITHLPSLNSLNIPRRVVCDNSQYVDLHVFADASERAYGACVYVLSVGSDGEISIKLLMSKSRVAPLKPTTIPRLELCAALVASRIHEKAIKSLRIQVRRSIFWTDSMIVLGWLKMVPSKLQTFVRNRVAEIIETCNVSTWRHVPTRDNPADLISRGVNADSLQSLNLWWSGPSFLRKKESEWPSNFTVTDALPEIKTQISLHATVNNACEIVDFSRFSNFLRLIRCVAYVVRFIYLKCKRQNINTGHLTTEELQNSLDILIKISHKQSFFEYDLLLHNQPLPKRSQLLKLNVFLDDQKIMRVGGRLNNSNFNYDKKFPIVLQSTNRFTQLLFRHKHLKLMHAGPQLLLASVRESYWPIGGRNLAKYCYRKCVICSRMKGNIAPPVMGNLPAQRLSPGFAFQTVGCDYAGPILSVSRQGRGCRLLKVYIVLFVCFSTKAIHLELVGDLTSTSFRSVLHRFISRRGKPVEIFSDNGTSFVGAHNELSAFLKNNCGSLSESAANEGIKFNFIPAYSPHFGGLWEAGVKSTKYHLNRVLGNSHLTYEELYSVLCQIEAILNSRPLTPLSSETDDLTPLTPGHFLIGRPLTALPVPDLLDQSFSGLPRYHRIEQLRQHFWSRWSREYIAELQKRVKWYSGSGHLDIDALVVLKDDNLPPLKWRLGRIVALHPGKDGISRVADIKTMNGVVRRAFSKICVLPKDEEFLVDKQACQRPGAC